MNAKHYLFMLIIVFLGCDKSQEVFEYREPYTGKFTFRTIRNDIRMCYDTSSTCVNGWRLFRSDTSFFNSTIIPIDTNKLEIQIGKGIFTQSYNDSISKTLYPTLLNNSELLFPKYAYIGSFYCTGHFRGYDSVIITINLRYGMGGYSVYDVLGVRND